MKTTDYVERNVIDPKGIVQVYRDSWFWCVEGDPKRALFYTAGRRGVGSPQCNLNQAVAQRVGENLKHDTRAQLVQIPMAFIPWED
jgi:hypothetical protein